MNISIGNTFSSGLIDFMLFGVLQGNQSTNWIYVIIVGLFWSALYYFSFLFLIKKFNIMTPGRGSEDNEESITSIHTGDSLQETATFVIKALGGEENIEDVDTCITRLRVTGKDTAKVGQVSIKSLGAVTVLEVKGGIQAIFGAEADPIKQRINKILEK